MHRLISFCDQFLFPKAPEYPQDTLHVLRVHCSVIVIHVNPSTHTLDRSTPLLCVSLYRSTTQFVKPSDAFFFDFLLSFNIVLFFDEIFDGKTMTVPPEMTFHIFSAHGLITWNDVFHRSCKKMPVVGEPCRKRRPVIKAELLRVQSLFQALPECVIFVPILEDSAFQSGKRLMRRDRIKGHGSVRSYYVKITQSITQ